MLLLLFQLGEERYALNIRQVVEVLPLVHLAPVARLPAAVAGVFDYRGAVVPVIDLCQLALQRPAHKLLSTRIVVVHFPDPSGALQLLGLVVERATTTVRRDPAHFRPSGLGGQAAGHLGPVATDAAGITQAIELQQLVPDSIRALLFTPPPVRS